MSLISNISAAFQSVGAQFKLDRARLTALENLGINPQTGTAYTLALTDAGMSVNCANASAIAVTVPLNANVAFNIGARIQIVQTGAGQITLAPSGAVVLSSAKSLKTRAQYSGLILHKVAQDTWYVFGDMG